MFAWLAAAPFAAQGQYFPVLEWQRFYGAPGEDLPVRLIATPDSLLLLAGSAREPRGLRDARVAAVRTNGEQVWEQRIGGAGEDRLYDACYFPATRSLRCAGSSSSNLQPGEGGGARFGADYWTFALNAEGRVLSERTYGGTKAERARAVCPAKGGFLLAGDAWTNAAAVGCPENSRNNDWRLWLAPNGRRLRAECWGGAENDWAETAAAHPDGGVVLAGATTSPELDGSRARTNGDVWVQRLSADGDALWTTIFKSPYDDAVNRVVVNKYGFVYLAGMTWDKTNGQEFWLAKLDPDGEILFENSWGGPDYDELTSVALCSDGGLILSGWSFHRFLENPYVKGREDFWLIRADGDGRVIWRQTFGGPGDERGFDVVETSPGVFYALGAKKNTFSQPDSLADMDFWLIRVKELPCEAGKPFFKTSQSTPAVEAGAALNFINQSKYGDRWLWEFGGGATSDEKFPTHKYETPGAFYAKLTVYLNDNCVSTYVAPDPIVVED